MFEEEPEAHENHERYLLTYADMITLLMALFIILFAVGQTDIAKFKRFQTGLQKEFGAPALDGGTGVLEGSQLPVDPEATAALAYVSAGLTDPSTIATGGPEAGNGEGEGGGSPWQVTPANADYTAEAIQHDIEASGVAAGQVIVRADERGVVIVLQTDGVTFRSGSWALESSGRSVLGLLAGPLSTLVNRIIVEGHTDDQPMSSGGITNWELSGFRAASVVRELERLGIGGDRLTLGGYGETRPIADNATPEGRAANRRVEIVLSVAEGDVPPTDVITSPELLALRAGNIIRDPATPDPIDPLGPSTTTPNASTPNASTPNASAPDNEGNGASGAH
jgi:chemotaxis protein MotB